MGLCKYLNQAQTITAKSAENISYVKKLNSHSDKFLFVLFPALYQDGVRNDVCIQPCSTMAITYGFPTTEYNATDYARIKLYFKSNVQVCYH